MKLMKKMGITDVSDEFIVFDIKKRCYHFFYISSLAYSKQPKFHMMIDKAYLRLLKKTVFHSHYSFKS